MASIEEIETVAREALTPGFRNRLLEKGIARTMIWANGALPKGAPAFPKSLSYDLLSYGYSLLSLGFQLKESGGDPQLVSGVFEKAGLAISSVTENGDPSDSEKNFHKAISASAYHVSGYSAKAYSMIKGILDDKSEWNLLGKALALLILREFSDLTQLLHEWKQSGVGSDSSITNQIEQDIEAGQDIIESVEVVAVCSAITDSYFSALSEFLVALETGRQDLVTNCLARLDHCKNGSAKLNLVSQWWIIRITKFLIDGLWGSSFHSLIPVLPGDPNSASWVKLRWLFVVSLLDRRLAEIELWPSQVEAAKRAIDDFDDLVVSLPTSAGKTRIGELCILRCLAIGKRVLFITPLRALSAQTETSLRRTFLPLGIRVSSLYGSAGTSKFEQDLLKKHDIVVGTPEKLDFALRNDPTVIDDVGLIILDEGHMIGLNEREIRYEVQVQRLLRREDADSRRIVCLSAILPDGSQMDDFVGWIRRDKEGKAIRSNWRPTELRYGKIVWGRTSARVDFNMGVEKYFLPNFLKSFVPPLPNPGKRRVAYPKNAQELSLASAWRLVEDQHTVLIYCPQKRSVNAFASVIIDLFKRGALGSVLDKGADISKAKSLGQEWLGENHPIIQCLSIGVAIHHGSLPTPFRKEVENLLRSGILKITISSPTLAQGLNLTATAVIIHSLYRSGEKIETSEFRNVVGRAGRAFVDTHGLVLHPIFDEHQWRGSEWDSLVGDTKARDMESGLVRLVHALLGRIHSAGHNPLEYILNSSSEWVFPEVQGEDKGKKKLNQKAWDNHLKYLDTALLSLIGDSDLPIDEIASALDTILKSSFWTRRLQHQNESVQSLWNKTIEQRACYIWSRSSAKNRKGYFLAGVGFQTGQSLDEISNEANILLVQSNAHLLVKDTVNAIESIKKLAEILFKIDPFIPDPLPNDWHKILIKWLEGDTFKDSDFEDLDDALNFVEDALVYRLPWGAEAVRVRALANEDDLGSGTSMADYETDYLIPALEYGTTNRSAAILMQSGFNSRQAAIYVATSLNAEFTDMKGLREWLKNPTVKQHSGLEGWPTIETHDLWKEFVSSFHTHSSEVWNGLKVELSASWFFNLSEDQVVKLKNLSNAKTQVFLPSGELVGELDCKVNFRKKGSYIGTVKSNKMLELTYWGPDRNPFQISSA